MKKCECGHCSNINCFLTETINKNLGIIEFSCFYCGWRCWNI